MINVRTAWLRWVPLAAASALLTEGLQFTPTGESSNSIRSSTAKHELPIGKPATDNLYDINVSPD